MTEPDDTPSGNSKATTKPCPECGADVRAGAGLCKACGYVFATGGRGAVRGSSAAGVAAAGGDQTGTFSGRHGELFRLARPIIILCLAVLVVVLFIWQNRPRETWYQDLNLLSPVQTEFDRRFQSTLMMDYRGHTTGADVRAADGLCLINIDTDEKPSGMINRLGGKLVVTGLACAYAEGRQAAGEGGSARVVLYFNRRRYSSADCAR